MLMLIVMSISISCSTQKRTTKSRTPGSSLTHFKASDYINGRKLGKNQEKLIREVCSWQGTPYKYGGADKGKGTDCSGLVLRVFLDVAEIKMPRNSAAQAEYCKKIKESKVEACDLVFFATGKDKHKVSHVGLMLDSANFIHSSSSKGVIVTPITNPWWNQRILHYGRVPGFKKK